MVNRTTFRTITTDIKQYLGAVAVLAGIILLPFILFWGAAKVIEFLYPLILFVGSISFISFLLIVLPLSLFPKYKASMSGAALLISYVLGAVVWTYSFIMMYSIIGLFSVLALFWFPSVNFIAVVLLVAAGMWANAAQIVAVILIVWAIRAFAVWLATWAGADLGSNPISGFGPEIRRDNDGIETIDVEGTVEE